MDQPTAGDALKRLEPLVGEWRVVAKPPDGEPWPGEGRTTFAWHESGAHLIERSTVDLPEAPDSVSIIGCDAANGTYYQLYSDDRGVCRVYEMSIGDSEWKLWRDGEPFPQRFTGRFADDGRTIVGRWELAKDGTNYTTDFDLTYSRVE
jgi:hypothetical protein